MLMKIVINSKIIISSFATDDVNLDFIPQFSATGTRTLRCTNGTDVSGNFVIDASAQWILKLKYFEFQGANHDMKNLSLHIIAREF